MSLCHVADLTAVCARSRTDVTLDHGAVSLLHHHRTEFTALAGRRLVAPRACPLREDPLERLPELSVEDAVDYRVEGRVTVAEPRENLSEKRTILTHLLIQMLVNFVLIYSCGTRRFREGNPMIVRYFQDIFSTKQLE